MPKKFAVENTKAVAAKARRAAVQEQEKAQKQKEIEDAYWKEDDKNVLRKQQRKDEKERKKQEQHDKKAESRALIEQELKSLKLAAKPTPSKISQAQINAELEKKRVNSVSKNIKKVDTHLSQPLEENLNRAMFDTEVATTVTEAISILRYENEVDKHPERRVKAAYAEFEDRLLLQFKSDNPTLRLSQVKQMIRKEWDKSPQNPLNQKIISS
ncbi:hypothetical protein AAG570_007679 [Ranatra chinensis]|uniref:Coiled-coil domain-containing protein n=1 Tax=Ranatra chinensis TaxID=642074 RepID=A0ABD0XW66_9HEMI